MAASYPKIMVHTARQLPHTTARGILVCVKLYNARKPE